jgi:hypothetical protein
MSWPRPDFLSRGPRTPAWAWALAAAAVLVLGVATFEGMALRERLATERERLATWESESAKRRPAVPRGGTTAARGAELLGLAAAHSQRVAFPWPSVFETLESLSATGVRWLGWDLDSGRADLRLEGVASDARTVLGIVDVLARRPGWEQVVLTRMAAGPAGTEGLRFEITARLGDGVSRPVGTP